MPLGTVDTFSYQTVENLLEIGDAVLLMSDGFPELFNEHKELFDYFRVKILFEKVAALPANEIVQRLFEAGDKWRKTKMQNDDITFVVIKIKAEA